MCLSAHLQVLYTFPRACLLEIIFMCPSVCACACTRNMQDPLCACWPDSQPSIWCNLCKVRLGLPPQHTAGQAEVPCLVIGLLGSIHMAQMRSAMLISAPLHSALRTSECRSLANDTNTDTHTYLHDHHAFSAEPLTIAKSVVGTDTFFGKMEAAISHLPLFGAPEQQQHH